MSGWRAPTTNRSIGAVRATCTHRPSLNDGTWHGAHRPLNTVAHAPRGSRPHRNIAAKNRYDMDGRVAEQWVISIAAATAFSFALGTLIAYVISLAVGLRELP